MTHAPFISSRDGASVTTPVQPVVISGGISSPKPTAATSGMARILRPSSCTNAARIEARLHAAQVTEALEHEARRRKQDEGEGDLPRDEHTARRDPATAGRERPRPFTEGEYVHPGIGDRDEGQDGTGDHRQRTRDRR